VRGDSWILISFNQAFEELMHCAVGDSVNDFPFAIKAGRSEIAIGEDWYSVHQFAFQENKAVIIMHNTTKNHEFNLSLAQVVTKAAACI
jgi:hypothetical protein